MKKLGILRHVIEVFQEDRDVDNIVTSQLMSKFKIDLIQQNEFGEKKRQNLLVELQEKLDPLKSEFDLVGEYNKAPNEIYQESGN